MKLSCFVFLLPATLFAANPSFGQEVNRCATVEYTRDKMAKHPDLQKAEREANTMIWEKMQTGDNGQTGQNKVSTVLVIPVVFHVVYNTTAQNNSVSDARIQSQLAVLNKDFSKLNTDTNLVPAVWKSLAANAQIQFCMATRKPNGDWTNGIERRQTSATAYTTNGVDSVKFAAFGGLDSWDYTQYLNIWVINFANNVLGITQMPLAGPGATDGICIQYTAFGTGSGLLTHYNKGRTATHEVGHWLGLFHIWGDDNGDCWGSDSINDTPNQAAEHYNCPAFPSTDSCSATTPGTMFMDYMDYSYDQCLVMFTADQCTRMNLVLSTIRSAIQTSQGCTPAIGINEKELENFISVFPNPAEDHLTLQLDFPVPMDVSAYLFDSMGKLVFNRYLEKAGNEKMTVPLNTLSNGIYFVRLRIEDKWVSKKILINHQ